MFGNYKYLILNFNLCLDLPVISHVTQAPAFINNVRPVLLAYDKNDNCDLLS